MLLNEFKVEPYIIEQAARYRGDRRKSDALIRIRDEGVQQKRGDDRKNVEYRDEESAALPVAFSFQIQVK